MVLSAAGGKPCIQPIVLASESVADNGLGVAARAWAAVSAMLALKVLASRRFMRRSR